MRIFLRIYLLGRFMDTAFLTFFFLIIERKEVLRTETRREQNGTLLPEKGKWRNVLQE